MALGVLSAAPLLPPQGLVQVAEVAAVPVGERGELSLTILEAPAQGVALELRVHGPDLRLVDNRLGWASVVDPQAQQPRLRTHFTAPLEPGRYEVDGWLRYVTCEDDRDRCTTRVTTVRWTVDVVDPLGDATP